MLQTKRKREEIVTTLRRVDVQLWRAQPVAEAIRTINVTAFS